MDKIITTFVHPPIPMRTSDWCAYHENDVERGWTYGWGETEAEALEDLKRIDQERYEAEHEEQEPL